VNGTTIVYTGINGTTSLCAAYYGGWLMALEYNNASTPGTCSNIMLKQYTPTASNTVVSLLQQNPDFAFYSKNFTYTNETKIGSAIIFNASNALTSLNIIRVPIANNNYGFFGLSVTKYAAPRNLNAMNMVCDNPLTRTATASVCSAAISPVSNIVNTSKVLILSTGIYTNYTLQVYSLINKNLSLDAHAAAAGLMSYINIPGNFLIWNAGLSSSCSFSNAPGITCKSLAFTANNITKTDLLSIRNNLGTQISVNKIACFIPGFQQNKTINQQLPNNQALNLSVSCLGQIPGLFSDYYTYNVTMNYTQNGNFKVATGVLMIPNTG
jgi:hypothetical protein